MNCAPTFGAAAAAPDGVQSSPKIAHHVIGRRGELIAFHGLIDTRLPVAGFSLLSRSRSASVVAGASIIGHVVREKREDPEPMRMA